MTIDENHRLQIIMPMSQVRALDRWRAKQEIFSRSEAIRHLVKVGIKTDRINSRQPTGMPRGKR